MARTRQAWCRSPSGTLAPPTTAATATSGFARRRGPASSGSAATAEPTSAPSPSATARAPRGWGIEVPVVSWPAAPRRLVRVSAQLYNCREQYARLAEALGQELAAEHLSR